jgi:hypothetical protein
LVAIEWRWRRAVLDGRGAPDGYRWVPCPHAGGLRDPDTVIEEAMAIRIREHLDDQVGRKGQRRSVVRDA